MIRRVVEFLCLACLLIAVSFLVLWIRSAFRSDYLSHESTSASEWTRWGAISEAGRIYLDFERFELLATPTKTVGDPGWHHSSEVRGTHPPRLMSDPAYYPSVFSFRFHCESSRSPTSVSGANAMYDHRRLLFPDWVAMLLLATPAGGLLFVRLRERRRMRTGRCAVCGYDLRATPERCPECGTPVGH